MFVVAAEGEQPKSESPRTNAPTSSVVTTNFVGLIEGNQTNVILHVHLPDGTHTNIFFRPNSEVKLHNVVYTLRKAPPLVGDFWLPGEFERLLEERKLQQQEKAQ